MACDILTMADHFKKKKMESFCSEDSGVSFEDHKKYVNQSTLVSCKSKQTCLSVGTHQI